MQEESPGFSLASFCQMKTHLSVSNGRLTKDKQIRLVKLETPLLSRGASRGGGVVNSRVGEGGGIMYCSLNRQIPHFTNIKISSKLVNVEACNHKDGLLSEITAKR
jgi:hypothetical protein